MPTIRVEAVWAEGVELALSDESGTAHRVLLDPHAATAFLLTFVQALGALPHGAADDPPVLASWPSSQTGVSPSGDIALTIQPGNLPKMVLFLADETARMIAQEFDMLVRTPRHLRYQPPQA